MSTPTTPTALVRSYYEAIDQGDYDRLRAVLAPGFVQERGDRTFTDREAFVRFMRDERPVTDTTHVLDAVYEGPTGVAAQGRLLRADDSVWFAFVDVFTIESATAESKSKSDDESREGETTEAETETEAESGGDGAPGTDPGADRPTPRLTRLVTFTRSPDGDTD